LLVDPAKYKSPPGFWRAGAPRKGAKGEVYSEDAAQAAAVDLLQVDPADGKAGVTVDVALGENNNTSIC